MGEFGWNDLVSNVSIQDAFTSNVFATVPKVRPSFISGPGFLWQHRGNCQLWPHWPYLTTFKVKNVFAVIWRPQSYLCLFILILFFPPWRFEFTSAGFFVCFWRKTIVKSETVKRNGFGLYPQGPWATINGQSPRCVYWSVILSSRCKWEE